MQSAYYRHIDRQDNVLRKEGFALINPATAYAGNAAKPGCGDLIQFATLFDGSDSGFGTLLRRSSDNGRTWTEQDVIDRAFPVNPNNDIMKKLSGDCFYDEEAGVLIFVTMELLWEGDKIASTFRKRRLYYRLSFDNGFQWSDPIYIYKNAPGFDKDRMFPGITYGKNMLQGVFKIVKLRGEGPHKGKIALGIGVQMLGEDGEAFNPTGQGFFQSGCLLGAWNKEENRYDWEECRSYAAVTYDESTRGVCEPAIEELADGRLVMVLRGSNVGHSETVPGTKWISISADQGMTWSRPERLRFDTGELMYSGANLPVLVKDRRGRVFYIGIINDSNPTGNLPRYPFCIAELDPHTLTIKKESVAALDTIREHQKRPPASEGKYPVDYSNQYAYLDAHANKIVVFAPYREDPHKFESGLNRYDVELA